MAVRMTEKQARALGIDAKVSRESLLDPILRQSLDKGKPDGGTKPKKAKRSTRHRAPKVARRISDKEGPEGTGQLWRDEQGRVFGLELDLELLPVPKERARIVRTPNNKTVSFTPARTKRFTADVEAVIDQVMAGEPPLVGPVRLDMTFCMEIPASWPKWKKEAAAKGLVAPTARPDMDNLEKALLDALNDKAFVDDSYVVERMARKMFGVKPGIQITVVRMRDKMSVNDKREALNGLRLPYVLGEDE